MTIKSLFDPLILSVLHAPSSMTIEQPRMKASWLRTVGLVGIILGDLVACVGLGLALGPGAQWFSEKWPNSWPDAWVLTAGRVSGITVVGGLLGFGLALMRIVQRSRAEYRRLSAQSTDLTPKGLKND